MILELKKKKIVITPMAIPEPAHHFYIQYTFEPGTNHLLPRLTIDNKEYFGNRVYINLTDAMKTKDVKLVVDLLDNQSMSLYKYTATLPHTNYSVIGEMPIRPDFNEHVRKLELAIEQLKIEHEQEKSVLLNRITELEEEGDVI